MATLTIKIESDELAREVLTHMGYLPEDDIPDLVSVEDEEAPVEDELLPKVPFIPSLHTMATRETPKTHVGAMAFADELLSKPTRKMPEEPKQNEFCTTEDPKPDVEPVDNELGAPLEVYSEEAKKERDELYKQVMEVRKSLPPAEERLETQLYELEGCDRLNHLDALADHDDPTMREAVKTYVLKEYVGRNLKLWPALQKILDCHLAVL